jgi:eukaryotic-like serine/threonine-protein kinase
MKDQRDIRLFELLEEASAWPEAERRQRAEAACAGGPVAAAELLAVLEGAEHLPGFLEEPPWREALDAASPAPSAEPFDRGDRVGRYRLLEPLGDGGMGRVFLAEQDEPYRRVALKLIRADLSAPGISERFRLEQQALARLNHPNIAQLFEADVTESGQPYFAMEWVDGLPIDRFFAGRAPDLDERLAAILDVCSAVRHAHQKRVIHRDLKPTNVLVSEVDGRPTPKVIDFGISEALDQPGSRARKPGSGNLYGTPEYLSPESLQGDVDTRADVYSLGVLLYELVTGTHPFRRREGPPSQPRRRIAGGDVALPSEVIEGAAGGEGEARLGWSTASGRGAWARRLRGDLDAIVMRAMHPDRDRRYQSVDDLAADVEGFLSHRPVAARAAGALHRLGLWTRRRRGAFAAAVVASVSLLAGVAGITVGMLRAQREAEAARAALAESEQLVTFLTDLFEESDPARAQGAELTAGELLDQGAERLRQREVEAPLARALLLRTIGDIYAKLGHYPEAEPLLRESLDLYRAHAGDDLPQVARALSGLAVMKAKAGDLEAGRQLFLEALNTLDRAGGEETEQRDLVIYHLGVLAFRQQDFAAAETYFHRACGDAGTEEATDLAARCLEAFGALRVQQQRFDEAETLYTRSLGLREQLFGPGHPHVAQSLESLCRLESRRSRFEAAAAYCRRSLDIRQRTLGREHPTTVDSLNLLASLYRRLGRNDEAEALLLEIVQLYRDRVPPASVARTAVRAWHRLAWISWLRGDYHEAQQRYEHGLERAAEAGLGEPSATFIGRLGLGLVDWKLGRLADAERKLRALQEEAQARDGADSVNAAWTAWGLAGVYRDRFAGTRDLQRAGALYAQALEIRRRLDSPGSEYRELVEADYRRYLELVAGTKP